MERPQIWLQQVGNAAFAAPLPVPLARQPLGFGGRRGSWGHLFIIASLQGKLTTLPPCVLHAVLLSSIKISSRAKARG